MALKVARHIKENIHHTTAYDHECILSMFLYDLNHKTADFPAIFPYFSLLFPTFPYFSLLFPPSSRTIIFADELQSNEINPLSSHSRPLPALIHKPHTKLPLQLKHWRRQNCIARRPHDVIMCRADVKVVVDGRRECVLAGALREVVKEPLAPTQKWLPTDHVEEGPTQLVLVKEELQRREYKGRVAVNNAQHRREVVHDKGAETMTASVTALAINGKIVVIYTQFSTKLSLNLPF